MAEALSSDRIVRTHAAITASRESIARCRQRIGDSLRLVAERPSGFDFDLPAMLTPEQYPMFQEQCERAVEQRIVESEIRRTVRELRSLLQGKLRP